MKHALKPLDQQVVVVTGASSGIGLCTALLAAERGAKVALVARSGDVLDIIVEEIRESGGDAIALPADVADRGRVGAMAVMNTAMSKLMPRVMDRLAPRYVREQQEDAPPHDPEGSLFRPVPHNAGRVYGHPPY